MAFDGDWGAGGARPERWALQRCAVVTPPAKRGVHRLSPQARLFSRPCQLGPLVCQVTALNNVFGRLEVKRKCAPRTRCPSGCAVVPPFL